jgi:hypothetical protein
MEVHSFAVSRDMPNHVIKDVNSTLFDFSARTVSLRSLCKKCLRSNRTEESPKWHKIVEYCRTGVYSYCLRLIEHYSCTMLASVCAFGLLMFDLLRLELLRFRASLFGTPDALVLFLIGLVNAVVVCLYFVMRTQSYYTVHQPCAVCRARALCAVCCAPGGVPCAVCW